MINNEKSQRILISPVPEHPIPIYMHICGDQRKPWVNGNCWHGHGHIKALRPPSTPSSEGRSFLWSKYKRWQCVQAWMFMSDWPVWAKPSSCNQLPPSACLQAEPAPAESQRLDSPTLRCPEGTRWGSGPLSSWCYCIGVSTAHRALFFSTSVCVCPFFIPLRPQTGQVYEPRDLWPILKGFNLLDKNTSSQEKVLGRWSVGRESETLDVESKYQSLPQLPNHFLTPYTPVTLFKRFNQHFQTLLL